MLWFLCSVLMLCFLFQFSRTVSPIGPMGIQFHRDPESHTVASRRPPPLGRIMFSAAVHTVFFGAMATATSIFAVWATVGGQPQFPKAASVAFGLLTLYSSVLLAVGPPVLARNPRLLANDVIVRQRSPFVKAIFSLMIMGLSWLVVDSFGTAVSRVQIMIMLSAYVYVFSMVRFFKVNDDGGIVDSLAGATFAMMMTLSREGHWRFRVVVGVVLALFTMMRAVVEYIEDGWRRRLAVVGDE